MKPEEIAAMSEDDKVWSLEELESTMLPTHASSKAGRDVIFA